MSKPTIQPYRTRHGVEQYKPSLELVMTMQENQEGFCLNCAETVPGIQPDARRDVCPACGMPKVYGAEELVLMNLTF